MSDEKKLYTFYCVAGIMLLLGSGGTILGLVASSNFGLALVSAIVGFILGAIFLHRASKFEEVEFEKEL